MKYIPFIVVFLLFSSLVNGFAQTVPGSMAGTPGATQTGAFTYTIPIVLPPGVQGVIPQISLSYNSQSGNGPLGMGWNLTGLSSISRTPANIYFDLGVRPVNINNNDVFTLNGSRLINTGPGTYRSPIEDFSIITSFGSIGTGPSSFKVESRDGKIYEYGNTADSRLMAASSTDVLVWSLNKVKDRYNNSVDYHYFSDPSTGVYQISSINYSGGVEVVFSYQSRIDNQKKYVYGGSLIQQPQRLHLITVKHLGVTVHQYNIHYTEDVYSCVDYITETGQSGTSLPSTLFSYGGVTSNFTYHDIHGIVMDPAYSIPPSVTFPYSRKHFTTVGDFNGDGFTDFIGLREGEHPAHPAEYKFYRNQHTDAFLFMGYGSVPMEPGKVNGTGIGATAHYNGGVRATLDYNGDGKLDIVTATYSSSNYVLYLHLSNGTGFDPPVPLYSNGGGTDKFDNILITSGNFLGNGKQQILLAFPDSPPVPPTPSTGVVYFVYLLGDGFSGFAPYTTLTHHRKEFKAIDFDGDGKDELFTTLYSVSAPSFTTKIHAFNTIFDPITKEPVSGTTSITNIVNMGYPTMHHRVFYGDFNGDGLNDVLTWEPSLVGNWEIGYSAGNTFIKMSVGNSALPNFIGLSNTDPGASSADNNIRIADFNGDGKDDILEIDGGLFKVYYSKGDFSFKTPAEVYSVFMLPNTDESAISVGDFNGDGQADILLTADSDHVRLLYTHKNEQRYLLQNIKKQDNLIPANGQSISVTYQSLPQSSAYTPIYIAPPSHFSHVISGGIKLVTSFQNSHVPVGANFYYKGLVSSNIGLGLRGFERIITYNEGKVSFQKNNLYSFQSVVPQENYIHRTAGATSYLGDSLPANVNKTTYSFGSEVLPSGASIIYPLQEINDDYVSNIHTKTTFVYAGSPGSHPTLQAYGKPDAIINDVGYGEQIKVTDFTYTGSASPSFFNQDEPSRITTTITYGTAPSISRTIDFTYNPLGKISRKVIDPLTSHQNTIDYLYDARGNLINETSTASGLPPATNTFAYTPDGRFMSQKVNALGNTLLNTFDIWGNLLTNTDANGLITVNVYDDFGRITSVTDPYGVTSLSVYHWANSLSADCPLGLLPIAVESSTSGISGSSIDFIDYFGKVKRNVSIGFNGQKIYNDAEYDADGNLTQASLPYYAGTTPLYTYRYYDMYGRETSLNSPTYTTTTTYSLTSSASGPLSGMFIEKVNTSSSPIRVSKTTIDRTGKVVQIEEDGGSSMLTYNYNSLGKYSSINANGQISTFTYDNWGNLVQKNEPNKGTTVFTYDSRDRLSTETDALSNSFTYNYDLLDRLISKQNLASATPYTYIYGTSLGNIGKLISETSPHVGYANNYIYDPLSRLVSKTEIIDGVPFTTSYTYDLFSRESTVTYPALSTGTPNSIEYEYNNYGFLKGIWAVGYGLFPHFPVWRKDSVNVFGQTIGTSFGVDPSIPFPAATVSSTGITGISLAPMQYSSTNAYNSRGFLTEAKTIGNTTLLNHYDYSFDEPTGNLTSRSDQVNALTETFTYDQFDRLTNATQSGTYITTASQNLEFAANGNILKKSDVSTGVGNANWRYQGYAVTGIPYSTSAIPSFSQTATYNDFKKLSTIVEGSKSINIYYKPDEQRGKAVYTDGPSLIKNRFYAENFERTIDASGSVEISYIIADGNPIAMFVNNGTTNQLKYFETDYQGSIMKVLTETGTVYEQRSYDAWGRPRNPLDWTYTGFTPYASSPYHFDRGYTGQEHLWDFNTLNLNGRLYDPVIARFFSPDPYITDYSNAQTYNFYSYCNNNPLKYTDKDGEWALADDVSAFLIGGVSNIISNSASINSWQSAVGYFLVGGASGMSTLYGGPIVGGIVSGAGNSLVSQYFDNGQKLHNVNTDKILVDGIIGGTFSYAGGKAGGLLGATVDKLYTNISSPVLRQGLSNATTGAIMGFSFSFAATYGNNGGDLEGAFNAGLHSGSIGFSSGLITGGVAGYQYAKKIGINPWTGKIPKVEIPKLSVNPTIGNNPDAFLVTSDGVVLPKECDIPLWLNENPKRIGSYGVKVDGKFKEMIRVDPGTPTGKKGPEVSHFHIEKGKEHIYQIGRWPYKK